MQIRAVKRGSACHTAHRKHLQLESRSCDVGIGFVPVDLRFHAPSVALRNMCFPNYQPKRNLAIMHVLANCPLSNLAIGHFTLDACPNPMRRMSLLPWRLSIGFEHGVDELDCRL
jgi:hypothetical protein